MFFSLSLPKQCNSADEECEVLVSVTDHGVGIPEHAKKLIFQPFTQADNSVARRYVSKFQQFLKLLFFSFLAQVTYLLSRTHSFLSFFHFYSFFISV